MLLSLCSESSWHLFKPIFWALLGVFHLTWTASSKECRANKTIPKLILVANETICVSNFMYLFKTSLPPGDHNFWVRQIFVLENLKIYFHSSREILAKTLIQTSPHLTPKVQLPHLSGWMYWPGTLMRLFRYELLSSTLIALQHSVTTCKH